MLVLCEKHLPFINHERPMVCLPFPILPTLSPPCPDPPESKGYITNNNAFDLDIVYVCGTVIVFSDYSYHSPIEVVQPPPLHGGPWNGPKHPCVYI